MQVEEQRTGCGTITFVIFTYNEEKRIEWAIRNFLGWGKILIVDNYSEDRTVEIARSRGCDILLNKNQGWVEDFATTERVKAAVQTEWIYWGFADEIVGASTLTAIMTAVQSGKYSIVNLARKNYYYGKFCHDALSHRMNRVFKKHAIDFTRNKIHSFGIVTVPGSEICLLDKRAHYVHHFISNDTSSYLRSMDRYTEKEVASSDELQEQSPWWWLSLNLICKPFSTFLGNFILRGGFKAGAAGLFLVLNTVYYHWLIEMKRHEHLHQLGIEEIERLNDDVRSTLLVPRE